MVGQGRSVCCTSRVTLGRQGFSGFNVSYREGVAKERGGMPLGNISSPWETGPCQGQGEVHPGAEWGFLPHGTGSQLCFCSFAFKEKLQDFPQQPFLITDKKSISCP